ncbi:DUF6090 family protein [Winogradskyella maritima]|uniref:DUF6090 family protein n=1 Tax=Winogradskyella maritima TaxID=1517766 RepID=A0ABV8AGA5_9FLAO|nr:DUF6090 family protein [Winogradskyella maritima]
METEKTGRYFKYALGEIILVVIGILIALQINNCNENRKSKAIELSILKELLSDSKTNLMSLEEDVYLNTRTIASNNLINDVLQLGQPYHDSLNLHFGNVQYNTQLTINTGGFENLKSRGFEYISNDSLRKSIIDLYDRWYGFINDLGEKNNKISIEQFNPVYKLYFTDYDRNLSTFYVSFKPLNYDELIQNKEFLNLIRYQKYHDEYTIQALKVCIKEIKDLIGKIESEFKK